MPCARVRAGKAGSCAARSRPGPPAIANTPPTTPTMPSAHQAPISAHRAAWMATSDDSSGPAPRASGYTTVRSVLR